MGLLRSAGRVVGQNRVARGAAITAMAGSAMVMGAGASMTNPEGVWQREVFPNAQELAFGNQRMVQESMRAGLSAVFTGGANEDVFRPTDYYYSRPVNLRGNENLGIPVSGEIVFGMYNLRR